MELTPMGTPHPFAPLPLPCSALAQMWTRLGCRREEGTQGRAALSAALLSEIHLNLLQSCLQVAYRFWFAMVAFSFYTRIR